MVPTRSRPACPGTPEHIQLATDYRQGRDAALFRKRARTGTGQPLRAFVRASRVGAPLTTPASHHALWGLLGRRAASAMCAAGVAAGVGRPGAAAWRGGTASGRALPRVWRAGEMCGLVCRLGLRSGSWRRVRSNRMRMRAADLWRWTSVSCETTAMSRRGEQFRGVWGLACTPNICLRSVRNVWTCTRQVASVLLSYRTC